MPRTVDGEALPSAQENLGLIELFCIMTVVLKTRLCIWQILRTVHYKERIVLHVTLYEINQNVVRTQDGIQTVTNELKCNTKNSTGTLKGMGKKRANLRRFKKPHFDQIL